MTVRTVAGWTALISGGLLVVALAGSAIVAGTVGGAGWSAFNWMVGGGPGPEPVPGAPEITVEARTFGFAPSEIRLPANADLNLTLANPLANGASHDLTVARTWNPHRRQCR